MNARTHLPKTAIAAMVALAALITTEPSQADVIRQKRVVRPAHRVVAKPAPKRVAMAPKGYTRIVVAGKPYYYHNGRYYRKTPTAYVVIAGPAGARVRSLPKAAVTVRIGPVTYRYYYGTYYRWNRRDRVYEVVAAPEKASTATATIIFIDGGSMAGTYLGGNGETIDLLLNGEIYEIAVTEIASITFHNQFQTIDG